MKKTITILIIIGVSFAIQLYFNEFLFIKTIGGIFFQFCSSLIISYVVVQYYRKYSTIAFFEMWKYVLIAISLLTIILIFLNLIP
jgi:hypothetical protein